MFRRIKYHNASIKLHSSNFTFKLLLWVLFIFILTPALSTASGVAAARSETGHYANIGTFEPTNCMFDVPAWVVEGEDIYCGIVVVPEKHSEPDGRTIELAVVVIKAISENPKTDPLFMAQGGPGGATIDTYAVRLLNDRSFLSNREIVLFDQRGTGYSSPNLYCTEMDKLISETIEKDISIDEQNKLTKEALRACNQRLADDQEVNFSAYNSLENASDIDMIRTAMGYDKINFYGVSYGTLLGMHYMRQFPNSLKSVVLDAVVLPQTNFILNSPLDHGRCLPKALCGMQIGL